MKPLTLLLASLLCFGSEAARTAETAQTPVTPAAAVRTAAANRSLDAAHPSELCGTTLRYDGRTIELGPHDFYLDRRLTDAECAASPYLFNDFAAAARRFVPGTATEPMRLWIAPSVYWIDDPDDPYVRGSRGEQPFGLVVRCTGLHLIGLNPDPEAVVLASQRGQTQGSIGNFTMFDFHGDDLRFENLTMGNYCNVDLDYRFDPAQSRPKRMSAITQAHVAYCHGDRIVARNVRFISRLNMNPLSGARRILFDGCHMESTDDALCSTGVYLHCTFDFYGQRPFYNSDRYGAVFLDCDFTVRHETPRQYFCKAVGPLSVIDCRYHVAQPCYAGWTHTPTDWLRCCQYGVTMNGQPYVIGADKPFNTLCLDRSPLLAAFRLTDGDEVIYNTFNLLRGDDDWDPQQLRARIERLSRRDGRDYGAIASALRIEPQRLELRTGEEPAAVTATLARHAGFPLGNRPIRWRVEAGYEKYVRLSAAEGGTCTLTATNREDAPQHFTVIASTDEGHEAAVEVTVRPDLVAPPAFTAAPTLRLERGCATVDYALDLAGREDRSLVTWYRATRRDGRDAVAVAVSRLDRPERSYRITAADAGCYLFAGVRPRHLRCEAGEELRTAASRRIGAADYTPSRRLETDFRTLPTEPQPEVRTGFWSVDGCKPHDTADYDWSFDPTRPGWHYGEGLNGTVGTGLIQIQKGARLRYTPPRGRYGDMTVTLRCDPAKTAGQGFGSATGQYMDLYICFDTRTLTGYALRAIRTTKHSDAVDFLLVRYENGRTEPISEPVSSPCFRTDCTLTLRAEGDRLTAHVETSTPLPEKTRDLAQQVDLEAEIEPNTFGGTGILYTGSCGESLVMLHRLAVEWR